MKILVIDDSALTRTILSSIIKQDKELELIGVGKNGQEAIDMNNSLKPDLILMDLEMPIMDGITAIKHIMKENPVRIIMFSGVNKEESQKAIEAIEAGAIDFIIKEKINNKQEILERIKIASKAKFQTYQPTHNINKIKFKPTKKKIIVIASSTGGPQTLEAMIKEFPKNMPAPILIVQHMPPLFTKSFAERLDGICEIKVKEGEDGEEIKNGVVYIAPGGYHMELKEHRNKVIISLNQEPPELGVRPNANRLFISAANIFKEATLGIVLTGMGKDGTAGSKVIKEHQGTVIAESEDSAIIFGMPKEVINAKLADEIVSIEQMTTAIIQLIEI